MIPIELKITGFLSYKATATIDFRGIHLACISGPNGAGKSSILDAFTWVLFGKARKNDDSIINSKSQKAEVSLIFSYEGNIYRIQRMHPREKTKSLEFQIKGDEGNWKPLTERRLRDTQALIERTLGMDYDTFVNASFFLQGKADEFTRQTSARRKEILSSILKLDIWEAFKEKTTSKRREVEHQISIIDSQINGLREEIAKEKEHTDTLANVQTELKKLTGMRMLQEKNLESINQTRASLEGQRQLVNTIKQQLDARQKVLESKEKTLEEHITERKRYESLLERAPNIKKDFENYRRLRQELERWNETAAQFHTQEKRRQVPLQAITAERARLRQERDSLLEQRAHLDAMLAKMDGLSEEIRGTQTQIQEAQTKLDQREHSIARREKLRQEEADARAENPRLKKEMNEIKARIESLQAIAASCPTCGKPLAEDEKQVLIRSLNEQGKTMGDKYRKNKSLLETVSRQVADLEKEINRLGKAETTLRNLNRTLDQLENKRLEIENKRKMWEETQAARLAEIENVLKSENYALEARKQLAEIDAGLKAIGYDASEHDALRKQLAESTHIEEEYHALERSRAALQPLERSISALQDEIRTIKTEIASMQKKYDKYSAQLAAAEAEMPDIAKAQSDLLDIQEQENRLRMEMGRAQQLVESIKAQKEHLEILTAKREEHAEHKSHYEQLEQAFGRNGVPALLIEQALPEIENKANEILQRLSGGNMSIRFITQRKLKDKKRKDLKDTLEIQISDSSGIRAYEMYSGGESFRVNFAIRLALSKLLANRAGGRLQTLVIDEGFGSQDVTGRQRLLEAINKVADDFEIILVITHIDEMKEAFPTRIEVTKTAEGSHIEIL